MAEYIERKAAIQALGDEPEVWYEHDPVEDWYYYRDIIEAIPVADVAPVRHGHWINIPPYQCEAGYKKGQQCSKCYAYYISDGAAPWSNHKYCAECGAKMDGEVEWESEQP